MRATIKVSAPKDVAAGDYPFKLRAVAVNDPDNDHAEGPVATAKVPAAAAVVRATPSDRSAARRTLLARLLIAALFVGALAAWLGPGMGANDGYDAAQREAKAESDRRTALALEEIGLAIQGIATRFSGIETRMETEAVEVAVAVARKLCSAMPTFARCSSGPSRSSSTACSMIAR